MIIVDESDPIDEVEPTFPYRDVVTRRDADLRTAYEVLDEIGRGKFGRVFRCRDRETGLMLAAKVVTTKRKEERKNVEREIEIMKKLQHPRLIQLFDAIDDTSHNEMCLILEMVEGGELFDRVIQDEFVLTERACAVFVRQISEAVEYIHSQSVLHLDMKPENVMCLSKNGNRIKIIDFGLARWYDSTKKLQILFGTPEFVAPEVVNFEAVDFATDMWSIGVITYVLLSGLSPFMGETDVETMANVTIAKYDFDDECFDDISEDAKDFISKLLMKDKKKRMTANEALQHPWLLPRPLPKSSSSSPYPTIESITHSTTTISEFDTVDVDVDADKIDAILPAVTADLTVTSYMEPALCKTGSYQIQNDDDNDAEEVEVDEDVEEEVDVEVVEDDEGEDEVDDADDADEDEADEENDVDLVDENLDHIIHDKTVRLSPNNLNCISSISSCSNNSRCSSNSLGDPDQSLGSQSESESGYSGSSQSDHHHQFQFHRDIKTTNHHKKSPSPSPTPTTQFVHRNHSPLSDLNIKFEPHNNNNNTHRLGLELERELASDNQLQIHTNSNPSPFKQKSHRSSSSNSSSSCNNLELTKDNLRDFVARWTSSDSPYLFDSPRGIITHLCTETMLPETSCTNCLSHPHHHHHHHPHCIPSHTHSQSNLSNGSFECGVNIVNQIRRFSYQLHEELQMMKNPTIYRKCSWSDLSVNAQ